MSRVDLKVGDVYKCPEGHIAYIVWISENEKVIAVKCPRDHLVKIEKVPVQTKYNSRYTKHATEQREVYAKDIVFLIRI